MLIADDKRGWMIPASFLYPFFLIGLPQSDALRLSKWHYGSKMHEVLSKKTDLSCHQKEFTNQIQTALWWESPGTD
jgi:hypothetical protein